MAKGFAVRGVDGLAEAGNDWYRVYSAFRDDYHRLLWNEPGARLRPRNGSDVLAKVHLSHLPLLPGYVPEDRFSTNLVEFGYPKWWVDELKPHQRELGAWLRGRRGGVDSSGLGVGKTRTALAAADRPVMIVCTKAAMDSVWKAELDYLGWDCIMLEGQEPDDGLMAERPDAWIINYQNAPYWLPYFNDMNPDTVNLGTKIADEAHWLHNFKTTWAEGWRGCQAHRTIMLTATPIWSWLRTFWAVLDGCQPNAWGSLYKFRLGFCNAEEGEYGLKDGDIQDEDLDRLGQRLAETMILRTRGDVSQDLPPLKRIRKAIDVPDEIRRKLFEEMRHAIDLEAESHHLALRTRQREQIGIVKVTLAADELIRVAKKFKRVVYWIWHQKVAEELRKVLENAGIAVDVLTGKTKERDRAPIIRDWKDGVAKPKRPRALIAAIGAASESISFTACGVSYMIELDYLPLRMQQAETRTHRFGQKHSKCYSFYLFARGTFDEDIAQKLIMKAEESERVLSKSDQANQIRNMLGRQTESEEEFMRRLGERLSKRRK